MAIERDISLLGKKVWSARLHPSEVTKSYKTTKGGPATVWVISPEQIEITQGKDEHKLRRHEIDNFTKVKLRSIFPGVGYDFRYTREKTAPVKRFVREKLSAFRSIYSRG